MISWSTTTIEEALTLEGKHYDFFRRIFDRVCTLCARQVKDGEITKRTFENTLKLENMPNADGFIRDFMENIEHGSPNDEPAEVLVYYYSLKTLDAAFKYCYQAETKGINTINKMIFGDDEHNYLVDVIDYLSDLEEITSRHFTGEVTRHFVEKAIEKTTKKEREPRQKGGFIKAEKDRKKMTPIVDDVFSLYLTPNPLTGKKWKSKAECARYFIKNFYLRHPDTDTELDPKKLVAKITKRINDRAASREVTLLADR